MKKRMLFSGMLLASVCVYAGDLMVDKLTVIQESKLFGSFEVLPGKTPPRLYYSCDSAASGGWIADDSYNGCTGLIYGTVQTVSGKLSNAVSMGSSGANYLDVSFNSALQLGGPFTLAVWIYPNVAEDDRGIFSKGADYSGQEYGMVWDSQGKVSLHSTDGYSMWTPNGVAPVGRWTHVAAVLEGSGSDQAKIYSNGVLICQGTVGLPTPGSGALYIGRWRDDMYFHGLIDDARIYDRALSASDVHELYTNSASALFTTNRVLQVTENGLVLGGETTIPRVTRQGDIGVGTFTNNP